MGGKMVTFIKADSHVLRYIHHRETITITPQMGDLCPGGNRIPSLPCFQLCRTHYGLHISVATRPSGTPVRDQSTNIHLHCFIFPHQPPHYSSYYSPELKPKSSQYMWLCMHWADDIPTWTLNLTHQVAALIISEGMEHCHKEVRKKLKNSGSQSSFQVH